MRDSFPNVIYLCNWGIGYLETETTIETGELLHDTEQEATVVTCVEGLNTETANYALSRI